jgi:hypothetical protein
VYKTEIERKKERERERGRENKGTVPKEFSK